MRTLLGLWSALAFALAGSLALTARGALPDADAATFLAVVLPDSSLVPIAVYDGETWWNRWPWGAERDEIRALPVPSALGTVPADWLPPGLTLPSQWRYLSYSGVQRSVRAVRPVRPPETALITTFAVQSDLLVPKRERLLAEQTEAELGLAIAGDGQLGRVVYPPRAEADRIRARLASRVRELERAELDRWWREFRKTASVRLEPDKRDGEGGLGLLRAGTTAGGANYYYLTGGRRYRIPGEGCGVNLSTSGVVVARSDGRIESEKISSWAYGEYCGDAAELMDVLGTLTAHGRLYWIVKVSLEDGHTFELFDPAIQEVLELKGRWDMRSGLVMPAPR